MFFHVSVIFAEGIFAERNFRRKEFSPNGIFAERKFRRTEILPNGIFAVEIFAERNFRRKVPLILVYRFDVMWDDNQQRVNIELVRITTSI